MSRFFNRKRIVLCVLGLALTLLASGWILPRDYPTKQTDQRSFVIDEDFTKVRKIMVRTDAAKQIITMGGGSEFVEQTWHGGSADLAGEDLGKALWKNALSVDPDWQLKLRGDLKVRTRDDYVGQHVVTLNQNVEIVPDHLQSDTKLRQGSERLLDYAMTTRMEREENHTRVTLSLTQEIKTSAPWFACRIADRRVLASVQRTLANQEAAMRKLIAENREKNWLFPLR